MFVLLDSMFLAQTLFLFFFFNDTATTEIYTLSLHDALPIYMLPPVSLHLCTRTKTCARASTRTSGAIAETGTGPRDRKSTRLNSSHGYISYAVFCLKKKKIHDTTPCQQLEERSFSVGTTAVF